ncbi:MAG: hypothetical protein IKW99_00740 [Bacteroidales bacterium]|nr:hypothetical protein [Bacteroidales bacterium]
MTVFRYRWCRFRDTGGTFDGIPLQVVRIPGHRRHFGRHSATGGADSGTPAALLRAFRYRWCRNRDTGGTSDGTPLQVVQIPGHLRHF